MPILPIAFLMLVPLGGQDGSAQAGPPSEPYRMVYSMAAPGEVMMIDLNSIKKIGDIAEAWSLVVLAEPMKFADAPHPASMYWMRSRLDCGVRTGQFVQAIGMENEQVQFSVQMNFNPTPLGSDWPVDEEFICQNREGARVAATTLAEAVTAATSIIKPPTPDTQPSSETPPTSAH